ncbi:MAG: BatA domain-containing protein, partial [Pseudomonadota bacterium]|nr:BatA domain-containing protein [Pseudomonadota bacterium]
MNFGLLLPAGLLALVALVVPVLLHLVRQSEQKRVEFAALRWLTARAQPRRRPRLDEWLLLLLRLLLLALLALWLAQPVWFGQQDARPWLLVHPAIAASRTPPAWNANEQRRWLAPGFPSLEQPSPNSTASIGSLLRELDASLPANAAVRVLVPAQFDATDAERPVLRRRVTWIVVPGITASALVSPQRTIRMAAHVDPAHRGALPY